MAHGPVRSVSVSGGSRRPVVLIRHGPCVERYIDHLAKFLRLDLRAAFVLKKDQVRRVSGTVLRTRAGEPKRPSLCLTCSSTHRDLADQTRSRPMQRDAAYWASQASRFARDAAACFRSSAGFVAVQLVGELEMVLQADELLARPRPFPVVGAFSRCRLESPFPRSVSEQSTRAATAALPKDIEGVNICYRVGPFLAVHLYADDHIFEHLATLPVAQNYSRFQDVAPWPEL